MKHAVNATLLDYDFARIVGPRSSAPANFEELVAQLLAAELGADAIDGTGGDHGIDCYVGTFRGQLTAFQAKYFLGRLRKSQRAQIKRSFETALAHHQISAWVLCIPMDPNPDEREWLDSLGNQTDWWGETKLWSLLAKHPGVARQFFREPVITARLAAVEEEVSRLRDELLPHINLRPSAEQVRRYIVAAAKDCQAAAEDSRVLYADQDLPWITIDFCELYAYLSADPSIAVRRPLIDFCLAHSPWSVILPPGTVYEIGTFVQRSPFRLEAEDFLERIRHTPEAQAFVQEFTSDPTAAQATRAYRRFVARMRASGVQDGPEVARLARALQSRSISAAPSEYRRLGAKEYARALRYFNMLRPMRLGANSADAANVVFLLTSENHLKVVSRMISSAMSMAMASSELCSGRTLVRTPRQFALLLTAGPTRDSADQRLPKGLNQIHRLRLAMTPAGGDEAQVLTEQAEFLPALQEFATVYRDLLRPVDDMMEDGFRVISRLPMTRAYYEALRGESLQVAAFRRFWNGVSADYRAIAKILCEEHGYEEVADQLETGDT